jgi:hypothetical protein
MKFLLHPNNFVAGWDDLNRHISGLDKSVPWSIEIKRKRREKTNSQLSYWWGYVVKTACDQTGNEAQDIHDWLCIEAWGFKEKEVFGVKRRIPVRTITTDPMLNVEEMKDFIEWSTARLVQEGVVYDPTG